MKIIGKKTGLFLLTGLILCGIVFMSGCILKSPPLDGVSMGKPDQTTPDINIVSTNGNSSGTNVTNPASTMPMNRSGNRSIDEESTPVPPVATTPTRV